LRKARHIDKNWFLEYDDESSIGCVISVLYNREVPDMYREVGVCVGCRRVKLLYDRRKNVCFDCYFKLSAFYERRKQEEKKETEKIAADPPNTFGFDIRV